MSKQATSSQRNAAKHLSNDHLYCRTIGHRWNRLSQIQFTLPKTRWGKPIALECEGCGMYRIDLIDARGQVSYRMYRQPHGYRIPAQDTPRRDLLRLELLDRS